MSPSQLTNCSEELTFAKFKKKNLSEIYTPQQDEKDKISQVLKNTANF